MTAAVAGDVLGPALLPLALAGARTVAALWLVTPIGGTHLPAPFRVGLGLLLAALLQPVLDGPGLDHLRAAGPLLVALHLLREALVGLSMGLVISFAFRAAEAAGRLTDTLRGANLAEALAPATDERTSPLGALYLLLASLVFLEMGGIPRLLEALARSYDAVPIGAAVSVEGVGRVAAVVTTASAKLIEAALALAAPAVVALWLTDLALGLVARAAPSVPVYFIGLPIKGLLAVGLVLISLGTLQGVLARGLVGWVTLVSGVAKSWH